MPVNAIAENVLGTMGMPNIFMATRLLKLISKRKLL